VMIPNFRFIFPPVCMGVGHYGGWGEASERGTALQNRGRLGRIASRSSCTSSVRVEADSKTYFFRRVPV